MSIKTFTENFWSKLKSLYVTREEYIADVQTQIDENFGVITQWTPKGNVSDIYRNYYIKTKTLLKFGFVQK